LVPLLFPKSGTATDESEPSTYPPASDVIVSVPEPLPVIEGAIQF
jgi:hypothetical protein